MTAELVADGSSGAAGADDMLWFQAHPHRKFRLREVIGDEFSGKLSETAPRGLRWLVLVVQAEPGSDRHRIPFGAPPELKIEHATERQLEWVFKQAAPAMLQKAFYGWAAARAPGTTRMQ